MEDIALQLFKLGDREHKGFIVKRDMQRLCSEVALPPEQLEAVFESLDSSHNGYLTLDQFLAGVSQLSSDGESLRQSDVESDLAIQKLLSLNVLHKSGELMCEVRSLIGSEDTWHQLLAALFSDLNQLLRQISHLEDTLKARDHHHQEELRRLYDELESQLSEERDKLNKQLKQRESVLRAELKAELASKDQQLEELTEQQDELQERLRAAHSQLTSLIPRDTSEKESGMLDARAPQLTLEQSRRRVQRQVERSYAEGFRHAQNLAAMEEEGLVKQLRLLQEMQENLKSGLKSDRHSKLICDDT